MDVVLSDEARQQLEDVESAVRAEVEAAFRILRNYPLTNSHTKYIDHPQYGRIYRYKVKREEADHRIFFTVDDEKGQIDVITVLHRDVAYDYEA